MPALCLNGLEQLPWFVLFVCSIYLQIIFQRNISFFFPKSSISSTAETQDRWEPVLVHWPLSVTVNITPVTGISFTRALDPQSPQPPSGETGCSRGHGRVGLFRLRNGILGSDQLKSGVCRDERAILRGSPILADKQSTVFIDFTEILSLLQDFSQFSWIYKCFLWKHIICLVLTSYPEKVRFTVLHSLLFSSQ